MHQNSSPRISWVLGFPLEAIQKTTFVRSGPSMTVFMLLGNSINGRLKSAFRLKGHKLNSENRCSDSKAAPNLSIPQVCSLVSGNPSDFLGLQCYRYLDNSRLFHCTKCWIVWGYLHSLLKSGTAQRTEVDYVIFRLLISDEPAQALSFRRNFEILISVHKSLLINDKWKEREGDKIYENFEKAKSLYN